MLCDFNIYCLYLFPCSVCRNLLMFIFDIRAFALNWWGEPFSKPDIECASKQLYQQFMGGAGKYLQELQNSGQQRFQDSLNIC